MPLDNQKTEPIPQPSFDSKQVWTPTCPDGYIAMVAEGGDAEGDARKLNGAQIPDSKQWAYCEKLYTFITNDTVARGSELRGVATPITTSREVSALFQKENRMSQLPAKYDEVRQEDTLPESPFEWMSPGHICVKADRFEYKGRILVPKTSERPSTAGRIVDVSQDVAERTGLKRGDHILYSQFAGYMFNFKTAAGMRVLGEAEYLGKLNDGVELEEENG